MKENGSLGKYIASDDDERKALLKYEIRRMEARILALLKVGEVGIEDGEARDLADALSKHYEAYANLLNAKRTYEVLKPKAPMLHNPHDYVKTITLLQEKLIKAQSNLEKYKLLQTIHQKYLSLAKFLEGYAIKNDELTKSDTQVDFLLQKLIDVKATKWLIVVVELIENYQNAKDSDVLLELFACPPPKLRKLANIFSDTEVIDTTSAIFLYKINPEKLFQTPPHHEKIISVQHRLEYLYDFIRLLYDSLNQALNKNGLAEMDDFLFHSDYLPQGIEITLKKDRAEQVLKAIKKLNLTSFSKSHAGRSELQDIFRAYKYWFNPNRLIDGVMHMHQCFLKSDDTRHESFKSYARASFQQLSTTECLDLYGYFANKDSSYLMRTFLKLKKDGKVTKVATLKPEEKEAIGKIYDALEGIMEGLKEHLSNRSIKTKPYNRDIETKELKPGQRLCEAIGRACKLYVEADRDMSNIDMLFESMEG